MQAHLSLVNMVALLKHGFRVTKVILLAFIIIMQELVVSLLAQVVFWYIGRIQGVAIILEGHLMTMVMH